MSTVGSMSIKAPDLLRLKIRSTFGDVFVEMLSGDTVKDLKDILNQTEMIQSQLMHSKDISKTIQFTAAKLKTEVGYLEKFKKK